MKTFLKFCGTLMEFLFLFAVAAVFQGNLVMLLWNWLVPKMFWLCIISFIEGGELCFLCGVLFSESGVSVSKNENIEL